MGGGGGRCNTALCGILVLYFRDFGYQGSINVSVKFITNYIKWFRRKSCFDGFAIFNKGGHFGFLT